MNILIVLGSIIIPLILFYLQKKWIKLRVLFNMMAVIAALVLGNISSLAIYEEIKENTMLTTNIHAVFLNPFFIVAGSYLGIYVLYLLLRLTTEET